MTHYAEIILAPLELIELYLDECDERNDAFILAELSQIEDDIKFLSDCNVAAINCKKRMEEYFKRNILS